MSKEIEAEVWRSAPVSSGALLVLLALADNADTKSRFAWPGIPSLARRARLSERQAKRCIKALQADGLITVRPNASPLKTNLYFITPVHTWPRLKGENGAEMDNMSPPDGGGRCDASVTSDVTPVSHQIGQYGTSDVTFDTGRCDTSVTSDVTPMSPKPSGELSVLEPSASSVSSETLTAREEILIAAGHDRTGMTASGRMVGNAGEMVQVERWWNDLGLSQAEVLTVIREVMARKMDGPPNSLKYFTDAMREFASQKNQPKLQTIDGGRDDRETASHSDRVRGIITAAAAGTSGQDWG